MDSNNNSNQDDHMMTDICENPSVYEKRSSLRIEKLKAQKHNKQQQPPVKKKKKKTIKVEESRNGVDNKDMSMNVCVKQQVEESRDSVESMKVCEEKQAVDKKIFDVSKRQKVEEGQEKLQMKSECVQNEMTDDDKTAYAVVTEALRTFYKYYLHAVQEEETRCGKAEALQKNMKSSKPKKGEALDVDVKKGARRPDLKALTKMRETNTILYPNKIGSIPGIEVGKQFFSRAEMVAVGFNSHWLNGIDCITHEDSEGSSGYNLPIAVVIVMSGQYEDDLDNCEDVVYTGQGGNKLCGNRRQFRDQVLEKGNLGLKNSMEQCVPVRVVRGHECKSSYVGKVYTYDGLYKVVNYWSEKGVSGFNVFKFRLKRLEGQPLLTTDQVQFAGGQVPKSVSDLRGLVCEDISGGQENVPIPATNLVDDPPFAPTGFTYCNSIQVSERVKLPVKSLGCDCSGNCAYSNTCSCATLNGSNLPYVHRDGGRLIEPKAVVYECGPNCGCVPGCVNRISQRGIKYRLEVYRTPRKGWAVRSWDYIPSGAPVCEYIGKLMKTDDVDAIPENNYIFDIDCLQTMKGLDGRERRLGSMCIPSSENDDDKDSVPEFCLDAGPTGNVARFINHSCQPNLFVQCVLSTHHDIKQARVVLFAADNIPPMKELTYDYGYALNSVVGPDGQIKQLMCYCGAGCVKPNMIAHGADQFNKKDSKQSKKLSSYFNAAYFAFSLGELVALTLLVWLQTHSGMDIGFGVSAAAMALGLISLVCGTIFYKNKPPRGSIITPIAQVFVAAIMKRKNENPSDPHLLHGMQGKIPDANATTAYDVGHPQYTNRFRFLDKACIKTGAENNMNESAWRLCTVNQVEQVKTLIIVVPIFACTIVFNTILAQLQTFSVQQGSSMDTQLTKSFHIPPASLQAIPYIILIFLVPLYDTFFVPFARKVTGHESGISPLRRIGFGLFVATCSMVAAAIMEKKRRVAAVESNEIISIFWITPQYLIFGLSEMFTAIGLIEFFYKQNIKGMQSFLTAMTYCSYSFGFYLSSVLVSLVNKITSNSSSRGWMGENDLNNDRLDLFYWFLAVLSLINFVNYLFWARWYNRSMPSVIDTKPEFDPKSVKANYVGDDMA